MAFGLHAFASKVLCCWQDEGWDALYVAPVADSLAQAL
jgi:hypothetical protein